MLTARCLLIAFATPWLVGAPIFWLLRGCRTLRPADWLAVPFVGLAAAVGPLQSLAVFADLPLRQTVPVFWAAALALTCASLAFRGARESLRTVPWRVVAMCLAVFLGQGAGVLARGVENYRGCLESDQYHYVVLAQFLMDEPYSTGQDRMADRPWLALPQALKADRIGQSVLHGFFAETAGCDALELYNPTQLLGPTLLVPAVLLLGAQCGLSRRWRTWAALAAAVAPGVEFLACCCFLSHVLCLPALFAFLAGAVRLSRGGGWRTLAAAGPTLALGVAVYTEFAPLFAGAAGAALLAGVLRRHISPTRAAGIAGALVLSLALNPAALAGAARVANRAAVAGAEMKSGRPTPVNVALLWLHYEKAYRTASRADFSAAHLYFYGLCGGAGLGALAFGWRAASSGRRLLPSLACASLLLPPLAVAALRPECDYVLGKLILSLAPVFAIFLACGCQSVASRWPALGPAVRAAAAFVLVMFAIQSGLEQRTLLRNGEDVNSARVWNDPDLQRLCDALRARGAADVVIDLRGDGGGALPAVESGALCYHARRHRVRLAAPHCLWMTPVGGGPPHELFCASAVNPGALVVRRHEGPSSFVCAGVVERFGKYDLVRVTRPVSAGRPVE